MRYSLVLLVLLAACSKDAAAPKIVPSLAIVAGQAQTDTVGKTLPVQLGAKLTDAISGAPLPGRVLNWLVVKGGGQLFVAVTQTGSDGLGKNSWTLGPSAGDQKVVARYIDPETGQPITLDTARATAIAGTAATFTARRPSDTVPVHVGDTVAVVYSYADGHGNATWACVGGANPDSIGWRADRLDVLRPLGTVGRTADGHGITLYVADGVSGDVALTAV